MAKPNAERLEASTYPWTFDMPPRFGDVDSLRHLNNVALARFYEDGRVRFTQAMGVREVLAPKHGFLVAETAIQYLAEGRYPDVLTVTCAILRVGRSSLAIGQGLFQGGRCIGTADVTLVHVHRTEGGARPLPEAVCALLLAHQLRAAATAVEHQPRENTHA